MQGALFSVSRSEQGAPSVFGQEEIPSGASGRHTLRSTDGRAGSSAFDFIRGGAQSFVQVEHDRVVCRVGVELRLGRPPSGPAESGEDEGRTWSCRYTN